MCSEFLHNTISGKGMAYDLCEAKKQPNLTGNQEHMEVGKGQQKLRFCPLIKTETKSNFKINYQ